MRDDLEQINPGHHKLRRVFRVLGPAILLAGVACIAAALVDFFLAFGSFDRSPRFFWMFFLGMPLFFVGFVLTNAGYMAAVARYAAQEHAPVAADTLNYLAGETAPAAKAVAAALRSGLAATARACPSCAGANDPDARFCDSCGAALSRTCHSCSASNDPDANFCDACGRSLS
ncbi:MAG TPA: zinc ribbon domain-containing protein [Phycisphaerales bacterium]|nr:zinc ribbon domain-containing protein [Phycisphaerales bacterium]